MIEIQRISETNELGDETLRERARLSAKANSTQLVAFCDGEEAGYASLDHRADLSCGVIYEVFVLPKFRLSGVGSALITSAETLARSFGCSRSLVGPRSLELSIDQQRLEQWYVRKGYVPRNDGTGEYEKALN